jgi:hypothetical protein
MQRSDQSQRELEAVSCLACGYEDVTCRRESGVSNVCVCMCFVCVCFFVLARVFVFLCVLVVYSMQKRIGASQICVCMHVCVCAYVFLCAALQVV